MLKKLLLTLLLFVAPAFGQQVQFSQTFTSTTRGTTIRTLGSGVSFHKLAITLQGTVTTCALSVDTSIDGTTWVTGGIFNSVNCLNVASVSIGLPVTAAFVSVNVSTLTGTLPSVTVNYMGYTTAPIAPDYFCPTVAPITINTAVTTQLVAGVAGQVIRICEINLMSAGTTSVTFEYGTGGTCGSSTVLKSGAYPMLAGTVLPLVGAPELMRGAQSSGFCIINSAAIQISGFMTYAIF